MLATVTQCRFASIDFESAGASRGSTDQPVQIGMAVWSVGHGLVDRFVSYLRTDHPVQWAAQKVHGITTEHLADAPDLLSLWPEVRQRMQGSVVVAHGKGTEKRFLRAFPGHGFGPWLDTLLLTRAIWPGIPDHSLSRLSDELGLSDNLHSLMSGKTWHDAEFDAVASLRILEHVVDVLQLGDTPVQNLCQPNTSRWRRFRI